MSNDNRMTEDERLKHLRKMRKRYITAGRKTKGALLDEMEVVAGLDRKILARLMNGSPVTVNASSTFHNRQD